MTITSNKRQKTARKAQLLAASLVLGTALPCAMAQDAHANAGTLHVLRLQNATSQADQNELVTAIRNMLTPYSKIFLVTGENAIALRGSDEDFADAQKLIAELDRKHTLYRLNYTVRDSDGGKQVGVQHFSVVVAAGQRVQFKQGSRVPIITGSYGTASPTPQTQYTYIDVGINFDATISELSNGLDLRSKIERSSVAEDKFSAGKDDPIIRSSVIESTSLLTLNKALNLGSLDTADSTRHLDVEVTAEIAK